MRLIVWFLRAALFFTLFAFALNNQHSASVRWFFSHEWRAPMVFIVLGAFTLGCAVGGLAMAPSWWRYRKAARSQQTDDAIGVPAPADAALPAADVPPLDSVPARHGV